MPVTEHSFYFLGFHPAKISGLSRRNRQGNKEKFHPAKISGLPLLLG
ncbi:unnamed protein product [Acidithrix sp. C25]|nr:unnamed protein product [Acidithrix sp. C25]